MKYVKTLQYNKVRCAYSVLFEEVIEVPSRYELHDQSQLPACSTAGHHGNNVPMEAQFFHHLDLQHE